MTYDNGTGQAAVHQYVEQEVRTAEPLQLVVKTHEIAVQSLRRAQAALESGDWAGKGRAVDRASRAIELLQSTLNMEEGGEIARNLDRLYTYFQFTLTEAHMNNDVPRFFQLSRHLNELLSSWREALARRRSARAGVEAEAAPARAAAGQGG